MQTITFTRRQVMYIKSMDDFYNKTKLMDLVKSGEIKDVRQIRMNSKDLDYLLEAMKRNLRRSPVFRHLTDRYIETCAAMDWLNYSPMTDDSVPPLTICIDKIS